MVISMIVVVVVVVVAARCIRLVDLMVMERRWITWSVSEKDEGVLAVPIKTENVPTHLPIAWPSPSALFDRRISKA